MDLALAVNTRAVYSTAFKSFRDFCSIDRCVLFPLSEHTLIRYVCHKARVIRYSSIKTYLAGIQFAAIYSGFNPTISGMHQLFYVLRGIRRHQVNIGIHTIKQPISLIHLNILFNASSRQFQEVDAAMLQSAMSFAFYGMLRVSEYTSSHVSSFNSSSTLLLDDVTMVNGTIHIVIKASKTDPFKFGSIVRLTPCVGRTCPVMTFIRFQQLRPPLAGPLFMYDDGSFLTRRRLSSFVQACFPGINVNTHSFRIGGASAAASAGIADSSIKILGRWSSDAYLRYIRYSDDDISQFLFRMSNAFPSYNP